MDIPENWLDYWDSQDCQVEVLLSVCFNENLGIIKEYTNADLMSCSLEAQSYPSLSIGNACSAHLTFEIFDASDDALSFAKGQQIVFSVRLGLDGNVTEYASQGVYYVDEFTQGENGSMRISAYDELMSMETMFIAKDTVVSTDTIKFSALWALYANYNQINVDATSFLSQSIVVDPFSNSSLINLTVGDLSIPASAIWIDLRTMIGSVAALAGGNAVITKENKLAFLRLRQTVDSDMYIRPSDIATNPVIHKSIATAGNIRLGTQSVYATGVEVDKLLSGTGWRIKANIDKDFAADRDALYRIVRNMGRSYTSARATYYEATGSVVNPLKEIGEYLYFPTDRTNGDSIAHKQVTMEYFSLSYIGDCYGTVGAHVSEDDVNYSDFLAYLGSYSTISGWKDAFYASNPNTLYVNTSGNQPIRPKPIDKHTFIADCRINTRTENECIAKITGAEHLDGTMGSTTIDADLRYAIWPIDSSASHYIHLVYTNKNTFPDSTIGHTNTSTIAFKQPGSTADGYEVTVINGQNFSFGDEPPSKSEITQVKYGGTGQTGVSSTSTISSVITAASGVSIGIARYSVWGKLATFYIRATPSAAKSGTWDVGTLVSDKRPADEAAFTTGNASVIGYITTAGVVKVVGSVSANTNVYLKATYMLA